MADRELSFKITAEDKASKTIDEVADKAEDLEDKPYDIDLRIKGDISDELDRIAKDIVDTGKKMEALGQETVTFRVDSSAFETVQGDIGDLITDIQRVDDQTVDIKFNTADLDTVGDRLRNVKTGVDDLGRSAGSSQSALANMIGNSAQDLGALAGVAGSAGVAVGQMAEYFADARLEGEAFGSVIKSFARVALPIAGLSAVTAGISMVIADIQKTSFDTAQAISDLTEAIKEADGNAREALRTDALKKWLEDPGSTGGKTMVDFLDDLNLTFDDVADTIDGKANPAVEEHLRLLQGWNNIDKAGTPEGRQRQWEEYAEAVGMTSDELDRAFPAASALQAELTNQGSALRAAKEDYDKYNRVIGDTVDNEKEHEARLKATTKAAEENAAALKARRDAQRDYVLALDEAIGSLKAFNDEQAKGVRLGDAFAQSFDDQTEAAFQVHQSYADVEEGVLGFVHNVDQALKDNKKTVGDIAKPFGDTKGKLTTFTQSGRDVIDMLQELSKSVGSDLQTELQKSGGDFDALRQRASELREQISGELIRIGVDKTEVDNYLEFLGLTEPQIEVTVQFTQAENARQQITEISSAWERYLAASPEITPLLQTKIALLDPQRQLAVMQGLMLTQGPIDVNTAIIPPTTEEAQRMIDEQTGMLTAPYTLVPDPNQPPITLGGLPLPVTPVAPEQDAISDAIALAGITLPIPIAKPTTEELKAFTSAIAVSGITLPMPSVLDEPALVPVTLDPVMPAAGIQAAVTAATATPPTAPVTLEPEVITDDAMAAAVNPAGRARPVTTVPTITESAMSSALNPGGKPRPVKVELQWVGSLAPPRQQDVPTGVPTSVVNVTQHIRAGIGSDRFAVQRAVTKANRQLDRLAGIRP